MMMGDGWVVLVGGWDQTMDYGGWVSRASFIFGFLTHYFYSLII